jgi:excisionase family DNA binding protein
VQEAAALLGRDRKQIYRWIDEHRIDLDAMRGTSGGEHDE